MNELFRQFSQKTAQLVGTSWAFILSVFVILAWAITGPMFHYSDTWQLVINTGTTIITFLMVFLIQNTQNRDAKAIHLKLDELLKGVKGARTGFVNLETLSDAELEGLQREFERLHKSVTRLDGKTKRQKKEIHEASKSLEDAADELEEAKTE
jgi:low affinity Fe/Cu permease